MKYYRVHIVAEGYDGYTEATTYRIKAKNATAAEDRAVQVFVDDFPRIISSSIQAWAEEIKD